MMYCRVRLRFNPKHAISPPPVNTLSPNTNSSWHAWDGPAAAAIDSMQSVIDRVRMNLRRLVGTRPAPIVAATEEASGSSPLSSS